MVRTTRVLAVLALELWLAACSEQAASGDPSTTSPAPVVAMTPASAGSAGSAEPPPELPTAPTSPAGSAGAAPVAPPSAGIGATQGPVAGTAASPAPDETPQACAAMVAAAQAFIASLDSDALRNAAVLPFEERHNFAYEPQVADRPGVSLDMMSEAQQEKALALLQSGLSETGFKQAETVRSLEFLKGITMFQANMRDADFYLLAIFGTPSEKGAWGWQWEGHHLALHYTSIDCAISDTPTFIGAWPSEVADMIAGGPAVGTRNLEREEDLGRALARSLDADPVKRMQAFVTAAYRETIPDGPDKATPLTPSGLTGSAMSESERTQLQAIVEAYAGVMPDALAAARLRRIEEHGGWDTVSFVWSGALEPRQRHYYRVQGESFMIEYRNNDGNHIHTMWRDFSGDFGDDLPQPGSP
jgi:hypothetical protein